METENVTKNNGLIIVRPRPKWRHKKRGTTYEEIGCAELQCADGAYLREGRTLVIYRGQDGKLWARDTDEFHDGRFDPVATPSK